MTAAPALPLDRLTPQVAGQRHRAAPRRAPVAPPRGHDDQVAAAHRAEHAGPTVQDPPTPADLYRGHRRARLGGLDPAGSAAGPLDRYCHTRASPWSRHLGQAGEVPLRIDLD